jgi:hypothetical protein
MITATPTHAAGKLPPLSSRTIIEGTNWVASGSMVGVNNKAMFEELEQINEVTGILSELTKIHPGTDHGRALSIIKQRLNKTFWSCVYMKGGCLMGTRGDGDTFRFGAKTLDILDDHNVKSLPVNYALAQKYVEK